jgi:Fe-S cluster biogenesis protein NfuA
VAETIPVECPLTVNPELRARVQRVLDEQVRPGLQRDGGDLELVDIDTDRIVQVRLLGACRGCSSSMITLTMLAERAVKEHVPEVRFLEAVP